MRPHSNSLAQCSLYCSVLLLLAVALAVGALMLFWPPLPVQAQSEGADNYAGNAPVEEQSTDLSSPQPTGKHLIAFKGNKLPQDYTERITALGGFVEADYREIGVVVASGLSEDAAQRLRTLDDVQSVDWDMKRQWLDPMEEASAEVVSVEDAQANVEPQAEVEPASPTQPSTAFFYPRQRWNMRAIKADQAWNKGRLGSPNVTVAILDSGIDPTHPDLQGRVDASRSTSFVPSDNALVATHFPGAQPWTDLRYHGTHVAATVSSNAFAAAGVTSKVPLMAVKVLDVNGKGTDGAVLGGIIHAAGKGADVINMSLGGEFLKRESHDVSADTPSSLVSTINRAINYANKKGTTIVVSAGNDAANMNEGSNLYRMFCESPHVVCVSATGPTSQESVNGRWFDIDSPASYSNYGSPVTVAAPGGNGTSSVWAACSKTMLQAVKNDKGEVSWIYPCRNGTFVLGLRGTSMAAPHTSGLAALLVEDIGKGQPSQVAARIRDSAEDLGDPDKDAFYGHGRINVIRALAPEGT